MAYVVNFTFLPRHMIQSEFDHRSDRWIAAMSGPKEPARKCEFIDPTLAPKRAVLRSSHKSLPSYFMLPGCWGCDSAFFEAVEQVEPNTHQFFPIEMWRKGMTERFPSPYYIMNIRTCLDAYDVDRCLQSSSLIKDNNTGQIRQFTTKYKQIVFNKRLIGSHHLWRGREFFHGDMFVSDELARTMRGKK